LIFTNSGPGTAAVNSPSAPVASTRNPVASSIHCATSSRPTGRPRYQRSVMPSASLSSTVVVPSAASSRPTSIRPVAAKRQWGPAVAVKPVFCQPRSAATAICRAAVSGLPGDQSITVRSKS